MKMNFVKKNMMKSNQMRENLVKMNPIKTSLMKINTNQINLMERKSTEKKSLKRGILFSTDALIALFILLSTIGGLFILLNIDENNFYRDKGLHDMGHDSLQIMKSQGILKNALYYNETRELSSFMWQHYPYNVCGLIKLQDKFRSTKHVEVKSGCEISSSVDGITINMPFIYDYRIHNVEMIMWYK